MTTTNPTTTITCKNCNNHFEGKYCFECGQAANTHKINRHFLWHDIQHGLFHFDKGILFSARELFTRPGATIREYIEGKRVWHFKPISMLVLLATVYGLLYHLMGISPAAASMVRGFSDGWNSQATKKNPFTLNFETINTWVATHFALVTLLQLPFYALASKIAFRKSGYNYVEHIVLNAFLASQRLIVHLLILPVDYAFNRTEALVYLSTVVAVIDLALLMWGYTSFFRTYRTSKAIGLSLLKCIQRISLY